MGTDLREGEVDQEGRTQGVAGATAVAAQAITPSQSKGLSISRRAVFLTIVVEVEVEPEVIIVEEVIAAAWDTNPNHTILHATVSMCHILYLLLSSPN